MKKVKINSAFRMGWDRLELPLVNRCFVHRGTHLTAFRDGYSRTIREFLGKEYSDRNKQ
ncbi:MAG: hypothetical protein LBH16_01895 [Treponema sp.]|jgi:hypothetical protein|nr:hypothetical protein [Treponema sp.]